MATRHNSVAEMSVFHSTESRLAKLAREACEAVRDFDRIAEPAADVSDSEWNRAETRQFDAKLELKIELRRLGVDPDQIVEALA